MASMQARAKHLGIFKINNINFKRGNMRDEFRTKIKKKINSIIASNFSDLEKFKTDSFLKKDRSIVTQIDLEVSTMIKSLTEQERREDGIIFYSEEDHEELLFPGFILDPIDGTRELVQGTGECALSFAFMNSASLADTESWGWIYNPFKGFELVTGALFYPEPNVKRERLLGFVSRSEYKDGMFESFDRSSLEVVPRGSIAFKLGLLASGACDFVLTKRPKSIWDIAAGTLLCRERGLKLYCNGQEVLELNDKRIGEPLLWCYPENVDIILNGIIR